MAQNAIEDECVETGDAEAAPETAAEATAGAIAGSTTTETTDDSEDDYFETMHVKAKGGVDEGVVADEESDSRRVVLPSVDSLQQQQQQQQPESQRPDSDGYPDSPTDFWHDAESDADSDTIPREEDAYTGPEGYPDGYVDGYMPAGESLDYNESYDEYGVGYRHGEFEGYDYLPDSELDTEGNKDEENDEGEDEHEGGAQVWQPEEGLPMPVESEAPAVEADETESMDKSASSQMNMARPDNVSDKPVRDPRVLLAEKLVGEYTSVYHRDAPLLDDSTPDDSDAELDLSEDAPIAKRAGASALRAYFLWRANRDLSPALIGELLRDPPLSPRTVSSYIAQAVRREKLPYEPVRFGAEVMSMLPKAVQIKAAPTH